ncbi:hypothetical protein HNQ65_002935 [Prosthecobacter vanneervenii]|uniref:Uncharacterized protein n=1 Tax=Prosthecobacter vanneervenii TaxID=48466 RepID=A0A7W8DKP5_9BACT|nr:hypothetical protein [Prosthecobacter vanneervenii]
MGVGRAVFEGCRFAQPLATGWDGSAIRAWPTRGVASLNPLLQAGMATPSGRGLQGGALATSYGLMASPSDAVPALMGGGCACGGAVSVSDFVLPSGDGRWRCVDLLRVSFPSQGAVLVETKVDFNEAVETKRLEDGNEVVFPRGSCGGVETRWSWLGNEAEKVETKNEVFRFHGYGVAGGCLEHRQGCVRRAGGHQFGRCPAGSGANAGVSAAR